jgi:hypothetical protein
MEEIMTTSDAHRVSFLAGRAPVIEPFVETENVVLGLTKTEAEDLLDWLDNQEGRLCELSHQPESGFAVRYR